MPIDVEVLNKNGTEVKTIKTRKAQDSVLAYLKKHKKKAFTQRDLANALEMRPQQIRQCCMALGEKELVIRKQVEVASEKGPVARIFWTLRQ